MKSPDNWPSTANTLTEQPVAPLATPKILTQTEIEAMVPEGEMVSGEVAVQIINSLHQQKVQEFLQNNVRRETLRPVNIDMQRWIPWLRISRQPDGTIDYGAIKAPFILVEKDADPSFQTAVEEVVNDSLLQTKINAWNKSSDLDDVADAASEIERGKFKGTFFTLRNTEFWGGRGLYRRPNHSFQ